jgi:murein tripeptide amidase MpaA
VLSDHRVRLDIRPEDDGYVNDSPWYAFRIVPNAPGNARISLRYRNGHHRYAPKISHDGRTWARLDDSLVTTADDRRSVELTVPLQTDAVYVAAQELVTPATYDAWSRRLAAASGIPLRELGKSRNGLPILVFDSHAAAADVVLLIGRQHPPEVTGAIAFFAFAETVFGDSELARAFRDRFRVIAIPLMNPDGVAGGHWRHNLGHVDINRDWGPFTQPETRLVRDLLDDLDANGQALRMFIDFHSTKENVFYTQQEPTQPPGFTRTWLDNAARRIADYPFRNGESPAKNETVAKNYVYRRYGIPAVTYEVADDVDRDAERAAARIFAEELMKSMLARAY